MSDLNGGPIPSPSDGRPPVTPPVPPAPDAAPTAPVAPPAPDSNAASAPTYAQPAAAYATSAPAYAQPAAVNPGRTLGIVGFILAFLVSPAGIIVSAIGLSKSRKSGNKNGLALAGLILSIVFFIIAIVVTVLLVGAAVALLNQCTGLGGGVQQINGVTITCPSR